MHNARTIPLLMLAVVACSSSDDAGPRTWGGGGSPQDGGNDSEAAAGTGGAAGAGAGGAAGAPAGGSAGQAGGSGGASGQAGAGGATCSPGTADCDSTPQNGCETNLLTSATHCGSCENACASIPHAIATCVSGSCGFTCLPTHADCDEDAANGCEAVLGSDLLNCGACGVVCSVDAGAPVCKGGVCDLCPVIKFSVDTQQACALSVLPGFELDAEAFITVGGKQHRVFALDRWGKGHVIAWCDATTTHALLAAFDVLGYLGQVAAPKVASFGDTYLCDPGNAISKLPNTITYLGKDMPALYAGDPAKLAADWDVILFCGFRVPWTHAWDAELESFVADHGKGLLAILDYEGIVTLNDFTKMTAITDGGGIKFEPLNLSWAPASTQVVLDCVPDLDQ